MRILVVGSTGMVGSEVARSLAGRGEEVRGLVRSTSAREKVAALEAAGVETVEGDLRDPRSLAVACSEVDAVITTASAMPMSWQENNTVGMVDRDGSISLIDTAKQAGIEHFVYTSFPHPPKPGYPLADAKTEVEKHLIGSGIEYTILAATPFMEIWLSPALGFDYLNTQATIYGDGTNPVSIVSLFDVARTACEALYRTEARNATLPVGGPQALTQLEIVETFEKVSGSKWELRSVPVDSLREQFDAANDEVQQSLAALQLAYATAPHSAMDPSKYLVRNGLKTVEQYAAEVSKQPAGA